MIIALASPCIASTLDEGLDKIKRLLSEASAQGAQIVCFPEAYLPGLRGQDFEVLPWDQTQQERALQAVAEWARTYAVATILGMERLTEAGRQIAAFVIDARGEIQGYQTKNQLDPTEDQFYVPGHTRRLFEVNGIKFGVAICHEGWRYPETVRWAAARGAKIVFHPHHTGSDREGVRLTQWGAAGGPYYEKAMMMRSMENTIYFASVNYALRFQESATSLIAPSGQCQAYLPYGLEGVLVQAIKVEDATGLLATRYAPERYQESDPGMLRPRGLDHVGLKATDMDKTLHFYHQLLGLELLRTSGPNADGVRSAVIKVGGQEINVFSRPDFVSIASDNAVGVDHFCLNMDAASIDDVIAGLRQAGIDAFRGPVERRDGTSVFVDDPDGVHVELRVAKRP